MQAFYDVLVSPITALIAAVVFGALAFSGKFNVTASQTLLVVAWIILVVGLREQPLPLLLGVALLSAGCLVLLGYWIRPELVPVFAGRLEPAKPVSLLFSMKGGGSIPKLRIGTSNVFILGDGPGPASMLFPALTKSQFTVEAVDGEMKVSTQIADEDGKLIAEIIRNEWKINPHGSWDRNYSSDALEVKDAQGNVILQVRVLMDHIQIQGMWWIDMGPPNGRRRLYAIKDPQSTDAQFIIAPINPPPSSRPTIQELFKYPSTSNLGVMKQ